MQYTFSMSLPDNATIDLITRTMHIAADKLAERAKLSNAASAHLGHLETARIALDYPLGISKIEEDTPTQEGRYLGQVTVHDAKTGKDVNLDVFAEDDDTLFAVEAYHVDPNAGSFMYSPYDASHVSILSVTNEVEDVGV